ncbi:MFS transporter [Brevibacillus thermoruber]
MPSRVVQGEKHRFTRRAFRQRRTGDQDRFGIPDRLLVTEELHGSYAEYGYVMASFPLGYVLGSMLVGRIQIQTGNRRMVMIGSLLIGGLTFMALGINPHLEWAILTETIAGMAMPFFHVYSTSLYQQTVPNEVMGSVFSVQVSPFFRFLDEPLDKQRDVNKTSYERMPGTSRSLP